MVEIVDVVVNNFHEGCERKGGVKEGEKGKKTGRQTTSNENKREEGERRKGGKEKGKVMGDRSDWECGGLT